MKKINLSFFALLIFFLQVIITDTIIYFTKINYLISNILAFVPNILIVIFLIKKKIIKIENNFNKWDLIFLGIMLILTTITIIFPDELWDSYSYHIYLQEQPFADKIYEDFFPGRTLTSFVFPIVDRIFYMFRALLGFRLGTLPGYLILIVIFYQIKKILIKLIDKDIKESYISILSILPLGVFVILQQIGTYYIDNFSIVVLLEFVYIILYDANELFKNKTRLYYLAFIVGIGVCIKITNAIYMILPLLYVLIKNIKDIKLIKWYDYLLLILTAFISMLPYFIDTVMQTGSPVFPYYNTIFKSQYFAEENWLDTRYGPKNLIQFLIWPIYIIFNPWKAYETSDTSYAFAIGYIISIGYLIYLGYKKLVKKEKIKLTTNTLYILMLFYFYLIWAKFILGYTRYAGIIPILSSIFLIKLLVNCIELEKDIIIFAIVGVLIITAGQGFGQYMWYGSLSGYVSALQGNEESKENIKNNISKLLKDREKIEYDIDGIWGVLGDDSAVPLFLNVDDKIVHLENGLKTGETEITEDLYWDLVLNNDIYIPLFDFKLDDKLYYLDEYKFELVEIVDVLTDVSFLQGESKVYICKIKYVEDFVEGNWFRYHELLGELK